MIHKISGKQPSNKVHPLQAMLTDDYISYLTNPIS